MKSPIIKRFDFYDTETSGINSHYDQIYQFAAVATDPDLNIIDGQTHNLICKPRIDVIPHPKAFLTHRLSIRSLISSGMPEFELSRMVQAIFMGHDNTCISGFNTGAFDNEMVRNLLFRNLKGPYDHEWKNGNTKFDIFKLVQLVCALRPQLLSWHIKENGSKSLKLEHLAAANGISHENAHDALSDVYATIELARIIKAASPGLWDYALKLSDKSNVRSLLISGDVLLHTSTAHGQDKALSTPVIPIAMDAENKNKFYCLDLRHDPSILKSMGPEEISRLLYTKRQDLPENSPHIPIISVSINKEPLLVKARGMLTAEFCGRAAIDLDACNRYAEWVKANPDIARVVRNAMTSIMPAPDDVYESLYSGGFISNADQFKRGDLHATSESGTYAIETCSVHEQALGFSDFARHFDLLLRGKWNSFHESILTSDFSVIELDLWTKYLEDRFFKDRDDGILNYPAYLKELNAQALESPFSEEDSAMLSDVTAHLNERVEAIKALRALCDSLRSEALHEQSTNAFVLEARSRLSKLRPARQDPLEFESTGFSR